MRIRPFVFLFAGALTSCASTPVWRAASHGPDQPTPTLMAAAVYSFGGVEHAMQGDSGSLNLNDAFGTARKIAGAVIGVKAVEATAASLQPQVTSFLNSQGFEPETDAARAKQLEQDGMVALDFSGVCIADTAAHPFCSFGNDKKLSGFMLFGPGSKGSIAERLKGGRAREAYASLHANFTSPGDNLERGVTCDLILQVLDQEGTLVFEGQTSATAPFRSAPNEVVKKAFDAAMGKMQQVVVL